MKTTDIEKRFDKIENMLKEIRSCQTRDSVILARHQAMSENNAKRLDEEIANNKEFKSTLNAINSRMSYFMGTYTIITAIAIYLIKTKI